MGNEKYGIHTVGGIGNSTLFNRYKPAFRGCRLRQGWKLFETSPGTFAFTYWTDEMQIAIDAQKYVSVMSAPAPASSNNTPQFLFNAPYSVPFVTTDRGTYPHFLNANFVTRFLSHWQNGMRPMLLSFTGGDEDYLLCWQSAEGSTGDPGTYKGDITSVTINGVPQPSSSFPLYEINDNTTWETHKRSNLWNVQADIIANNFPAIHQMINVGNDFADIDWLVANIPGAWFKIGYPAHTYNLPGEKWQQEGIKNFANSAQGEYRMQAEGENFEKLSWFGNGGTAQATQNIRAILQSFAAHGGDIINMSLADMNSYFGNDLTLMNWANQYLGFRKVTDTDKGFLVPRMVIDIAADLYSTVPISTYPVINPSQLATYNSRVATINANTVYSSVQKKMLIMHEKVNALNPARITALRAAYPGAAYHYPDYDQDQDAYNQDFGVDMMQNYEKFVYQSILNSDEEGIYRFGDRWGKKASRWYIWTDLLTGGTNYQTKVIVRYLDDNVSWDVLYNDGTTTQIAGSIVGGNTGNILTAVFTIPNMQGGRVMTNSCDFTITTNTTDKVSISQIDFVRVAENVTTNQPPAANAGSNVTMTLPDNSTTLIGTGSTDPDGTIAAYLWEALSGDGFITNPNSAISGLTGLSVGVHLIQLTVTDNLGLTDVTTVTITVQETIPVNEPPVANAGPNQAIQLTTTTATLNGTGSTDDVGITDQLWVFVSGPVTPSITTPGSLTTGVTGLTLVGDYIFRLYVQDADDEIDHDAVRIRINAASNPPIALINTPDTTIELPVDTVDIDATVAAGDNPVDTIDWTQQSGPAAATITPATGSTLEVAFQGHPFTISSYAFTLKGTVAEGDYVQFDFSINLNPVDPPVDYSINSTVLAGWTLTDLITDLYNKAFALDSNTLTYTDGDGNDGVRVRGFDTSDGLAEVTVFSDGADVTVSDLIAGIYIFRITATDTLGNESFDEITIIVNEEPVISNPIAVIAAVGTVNMPAALQELDGRDSYDPGGFITGYLWEIAGDSPVLSGYSIVTPTESQSVITFTQPGVFKFNLTVTDNDSNTNTTSVTFKVNEPPTITLNPDTVELVLPVNSVSIDATVIDIDGTVILQWVKLLGGAATIDDPTSADITITDLEEGEYLFRLYATDDDGAQVYEDLHIYVNVADGAARFRKIFLFYLCNQQGLTYKYENGIVSLVSNKALRYAPEGWQDIEVKLPRNSKYLGLERNFTSSYKFVKDGAAIIRYLLLNQTQRGIESKLHLVVLKWDSVTDQHDPYFTSEVDLSEIDDDPKTGVTVNLIQGGAVKSIKTNDAVVYEIACNESNPLAKQIVFPGIDLFDKVTYKSYEVDVESHLYSIPLVYISHDGDSVGVETANQNPDQLSPSVPYFADLNDYFINGVNYPFRTTLPITQAHITGSVKLTPLEKVNVSGVGVVRFYLWQSQKVTPLSERIFLGELSDPVVGDEYEFVLDQFVDIAANEKIYIGADIVAFGTDAIHRVKFTADVPVYINYTTRVPETTNYALEPFDLFSALVEKMTNGEYKCDSALLKEKWYLFAIAGDSLRGIANAMIKTSLADFYESYGKILGAAIGVRQSDQCILFEKKEFFFDNDTEIIDLGEVEGLHISVAKEFLYNTANVGYPDQDYQQRNGRNEFNSEQSYTLPQSRVVAALDLISKYRADPYGIEFIRFELFNKQTTDNVGDNNVFIVNIDDADTQYGQFNGSTQDEQEIVTEDKISFDNVNGADFTPNVDNDEFTFGGTAQNVSIGINLELAGSNQTTYAYINKNGSAAFAKQILIVGGTGGSTFGIVSLALVPGDIISFTVVSVIGGTFTVTTCSFTIGFFEPSLFVPKRLTYDAITGIESASSIYNIEELTSKRILLANYFYMGMYYQTPGDLVQFQSGKKNVLLSTTLDDVTITENANVRIEQFAASPVRPIMFEFNTKVPVNILYLLQNADKGYISFTWNGFRIKAFPMELSVKPAFRDAQQWKCLASSLTDLPGLETINENVLLIEDNGMISHHNSLKFLPVVTDDQLQYHFKHIDNEFHRNRISRYSVTKQYYQKQQTNDTTPIQFVVRSASCVIKILNCKGRIIDTVTPSQVVNAAVKMPMLLMQAEIDWSQYTEGIYYVMATFGVGSHSRSYISEPIMLAEDWAKTLLIDFGNSLNKPSIIYNGGYRGKIRFEGFIQKFDVDSRWTSFEDEPLDVDTLEDVSYRRWELFIGGDFGMPDWLYEKIARVLKLDSVLIDGYYYQVEPGAKFEPVQIPGSPYMYSRILIREQNNRQGIPISGVGFDGGQLTVEYNINTKAFTALQTPTVDQLDVIVKVTDVD